MQFLSDAARRFFISRNYVAGLDILSEVTERSRHLNLGVGNIWDPPCCPELTKWPNSLTARLKSLSNILLDAKRRTIHSYRLITG
jgi:hypothetical protein